MLLVLGKYARLAWIAVILTLVFWTAHSINAGPRAYHYLKNADPSIHGIQTYLSGTQTLPDADSKAYVSDFLQHARSSILNTATYASPTMLPTSSPPIPNGGSATGGDDTENTEIKKQEAEDSSNSYIEGQNVTGIQVYNALESILDLDRHNIPRMQCPGEQIPHPRYEVLHHLNAEKGIQYLFTMNLYQSMPVLNRLMATVVQAIRCLGPDRCAISIIEGRSTDGTYTVLDSLLPFLQHLGVPFWLNASDIDPYADGHNRIGQLARLRNQAIEPLLLNPHLFVSEPQIVFLNDIVGCPDDILEILYQHHLQNATQTCAMDWVENGSNFYDVWVSRTMTGNIFWEIPQDGSWVFSKNLFWDDPPTKKKFETHEPFQVFSCWGGMTVIQATPFLHDDLRFRRNVEGECFGGEPQMLGHDLAKLGISKVQSLPSVNVGYDSNEAGAAVKSTRKYVHELVDVSKPVSRFEHDGATARIRWAPPPAKIRCMPGLGDISWVDPWYDPGKNM